MKIKCIAVDDEPPALRLMEDFAKKVPFLDLKATFTDPFAAVEFLEQNAIDLIFLDVNMPDIRGTELLRRIGPSVMAVFCTAHADYAVEGFELQAVDYLMKPFSFERFLAAACKVQEQILLRRSSTETAAPGFIFVKSEYSLVKINTDEITLVEGLKDYIRIHTTTAKPILSLQSMRSLAEKLPATKFCRVHKSFIVNIAFVKSVQRNFILTGDREIPIGSQYRDAFFTLIGNSIPK